MQNWKSTVAGALLAGADVLVQSLNNTDLTDWKNWIRPILIAVLGYVVADAKKSVQLVVLFLGASFLLQSCAEFPITARLDTEYGTITTDAKGHIVISPIAKPIIIPLHEK